MISEEVWNLWQEKKCTRWLHSEQHYPLQTEKWTRTPLMIREHWFRYLTASSHYLSQCRSRSILPFVVTGPQWAFYGISCAFIITSQLDSRTARCVSLALPLLLSGIVLTGGIDSTLPRHQVSSVENTYRWNIWLNVKWYFQKYSWKSCFGW